MLATPSVFALGLAVPDAARREVSRLRRSEPWYPAAAAALAAIQNGTATAQDWADFAPFTYGSWAPATQAYDASMEDRRNPDAAAAFVADGAFDRRRHSPRWPS